MSEAAKTKTSDPFTLERGEHFAQEWQGRRILLYPAGQTASALLLCTSLREIVIALGDSNPSLNGKTVNGLPILSPDQIPQFAPDVVLIASPTFESEIFAELAWLDSHNIPRVRLSEASPVSNPLTLWRWNRPFADVYRSIMDRTLVDESRCFQLWQWSRQALSIQGQFAEVGVYLGGTAGLLAEVLRNTDRQCHLFDTFEGMPDTDPNEDLHRRGDFSDTSLSAVQKHLKEYSNLSFHKGIFPGTAKSLESERFAFVHVDADIYSSVWDCCTYFYPRLSPGGVMIFDDYGFIGTPGSRKAVDTFFADLPETPCYLPTGQCLVVRLPV
jgi:O-methyltransferase